MFSQIEEKLPSIRYISFINNLDFLISGQSIKIVGKLLKKASKITMKCETNNLVTYAMRKTKIVLFFKIHHQ